MRDRPQIPWSRLVPGSVPLRAGAAAALITTAVLALGLGAWRDQLERFQQSAMFDRANAELNQVEAALATGGVDAVRKLTGNHVEVINRAGTVVWSSESVRPAEVGRRPAPTEPFGEYSRIAGPVAEDSGLHGPLLVMDRDVYTARPDSLDATPETVPAQDHADQAAPDDNAPGEDFTTHLGDYTTRVFIPTENYLGSATIDAALRWQLPLVVLAAAVMVGTVSRLALRPVDRMTARARLITSGQVHHRLPVPRGRDPVARLAVTVNRMLDRLEQSDEQQRRFIGDAAHELRSPLATVRTLLEISRDSTDPAELAATIGVAAAEVDRLTRLSDDLLLLARLDARVTTPEGVVDLAELARDDVAMRPARIDVRAAEPVLVVGVESQLRRVLTNLIDNAARHAASTVTVTVSAPGARARLEVADDGPGVPADQRELVFDRFVRLDADRDRRGGGAGLGLAIVRRIVTAHGGRVWVADSAQGACFTVDLPCADSLG